MQGSAPWLNICKGWAKLKKVAASRETCEPCRMARPPPLASTLESREPSQGQLLYEGQTKPQRKWITLHG